MELKSFVDFAYSLTNMDEVKNGKFILPKEVVFDLNEGLHREIHDEIQREKNQSNKIDLNREFEVEIFGVNFKFLEKK